MGRKNWYLNQNSRVEHAAFGEMKKTISTTLPISAYEFAKENNIQFSFLLTNAIKECMGESGFITKEKIKENLAKITKRHETLINLIDRAIGQEKTDEILNQVEEVLKVQEKLQ